MLLQVLLIVFVALLFFRGGALATRFLSNAKEAKKEFDRTLDPVKHAKAVTPKPKSPSGAHAVDPDEILPNEPKA